MVYFYDKNNRYIGSRELCKGEECPPSATTISVTLLDGQEAHFINGHWIVSEIVEVGNVGTQAPTAEERIEMLEMALMELTLL